MSLGNDLYSACKKSGLSQEDAAEKIGVSRRTVSEYELDQSLPNIFQAKRLARLYGLDLDELLSFNAEQKEIEAAIDGVSEQTQQKTDWTKMRGRKYPVLLSYWEIVDSSRYAAGLRQCRRILKNYGYSDTDAVPVLKDILSKVWKSRQAVRSIRYNGAFHHRRKKTSNWLFLFFSVSARFL